MMATDTAPHDAWLTDLVGQSLAGVPALADQLVEQLWEDVYDPAGPVHKDDLWRSCRDNFGAVLAAIGGAGPSPADMLRTARGTGVQRARQQCPLEWVLQAWHAGGQIMWNDLVSRAGTRDPAQMQQLTGHAGAIWGVIERSSFEMAAAYERVKDQQRPDTDHHLAEIVGALLDGHAAEFHTEAAHALRLGPHQRFVVAAVEDTAAYGGSSAALRQALQRHGIHSAWGQRAGVHAGIISAAERDAPEESAWILRQPAAGRIGLSPALNGLHRVPAGYRMATLAMATLPPARPAVMPLDECLPDALLLSSPELAQRLVTATFGPVLALPQRERDELLRTVEAWVASLGSVLGTARVLYCHRNTVLNRLHRVQALTNLDVHNAAVWPQLMLGLSALRQAPHLRAPAS
jgi:hypothetical protein